MIKQKAKKVKLPKDSKYKKEVNSMLGLILQKHEDLNYQVEELEISLALLNENFKGFSNKLDKHVVKVNNLLKKI